MRAVLSCIALVATALLASLVPACSCGDPTNVGDDVDAAGCGAGDACTDPQLCRFDTCIDPPPPCDANQECPGDRWCDVGTNECIPYGVGPGGTHDDECTREVVPGVFFPGVQCEWLGPPAGDPFPDHKNVLGSPMVAVFDASEEFVRPWIVVVTYNGIDGGSPACASTDPAYFGVIRILDGRSCAQLATLSAPTVVGSASVALGNLGGFNSRPEIV